MTKRKMDSRELGLVLGRQLLGLDDLHYGLWEPDLPLGLAHLAEAQQRYNDLLIANLPPSGDGLRVLDVGCGTGHLLRQLLDRGYHADGVIPARDLGDILRERVTGLTGYQPVIFDCRLEDVPLDRCRRSYDVVLFSESFHLVPLDVSLPTVASLLKPGGLLMICDFFKTDAHGDGGIGDRSFGGGHPFREFKARMAETAFVPLKDEDITAKVGANFELVNDILMNRVKPASSAIHRYLSDNYPLSTGALTWLLRRRIEKIRYKYFSGHRSREVFEKYKTYHLLLYRLPPANGGTL